MITRPVRGIFLNQLDEAHINPYLVLLDSMSSHHLFRNEILMAIVAFSFFNTVARRKGIYPDRIYEYLQIVILSVDFSFCQRSHTLYYVGLTIEPYIFLYMIKEINNLCPKYRSRGVRVVKILAKIEFEAVPDDIPSIRVIVPILVCCRTDGYVPKIERFIQTQKNKTRFLCHSMP